MHLERTLDGKGMASENRQLRSAKRLEHNILLLAEYLIFMLILCSLPLWRIWNLTHYETAQGGP